MKGKGIINMENKDKDYYFKESEEFFKSLSDDKEQDEVEVKDINMWVSQR